jgi:hypothetical protein
MGTPSPSLQDVPTLRGNQKTYSTGGTVIYTLVIRQAFND